MSSDRTPGLLADLRADLDADAQAEQAHRAAAKAAKAAEEAQRQAATEAAHQAAITARLESEARRKALVAQARAEAAAPVVPVAPSTFESPAMPIEQPIVAAPVAQVQPPAPRGAGFWLAVVGLPMICATVIAVAAIWQHQPAPAPTVTAPPPPVFQVADSPAPEAEVMPTAHTVATPEPAPIKPVKSVAKPSKARRGKRIKKGPRRIKPTAPKKEILDLGNDIFNAD